MPFPPRDNSAIREAERKVIIAAAVVVDTKFNHWFENTALTIAVDELHTLLKNKEK